MLDKWLPLGVGGISLVDYSHSPFPATQTGGGGGGVLGPSGLLI